MLSRPGHSPSDTVFWDAERRILIAADHLIGHISSNPLISRPLDGSDERPRALVNYVESMRKTRAMPAELVLSGHGDPITNHVIQDVHLARVKNQAFEVFKTIPQVYPSDVIDRCNLVENPDTNEAFTPDI